MADPTLYARRRRRTAIHNPTSVAAITPPITVTTVAPLPIDELPSIRVLSTP